MKGLLSKAVKALKSALKASIRFLIQKTLRKHSYKLFGIPTGVIHEVEVVSVFPPSSFQLGLPKTIDRELLLNFDANKRVDLSEEGIIYARKAIATTLGGNINEKGKIIRPHTLLIDGKTIFQHDLFRFSSSRFFPRIFKSEEPISTLLTGRQSEFYHWIYEVLPRFELIEKTGNDNLKMFIETKAPFQKESLKLLKISEDQIIKAENFDAVSTPILVIPSIPEIPTQRTCKYLREKFLPCLTPKKKQRLYISRSDAMRRKVINEKEVMDRLSSYGFVSIALAKHSLKEQMEFFHSAEIIVGPHGAGFSHLVFCQPGTKVLEIFSPSYINNCYWLVANQIPLDYLYLLGRGDSNIQKDLDIFVDCDQLEVALKKLIV